MQDWQIVNLIQSGLAVLAVGLVVYSPIARSIGKRILHGKTPLAPPLPSAADGEGVELLSAEVAALREQLEATQERLDFTERLLAQARERGQLGPGNGR